MILTLLIFLSIFERFALCSQEIRYLKDGKLHPDHRKAIKPTPKETPNFWRALRGQIQTIQNYFVFYSETILLEPEFDPDLPNIITLQFGEKSSKFGHPRFNNIRFLIKERESGSLSDTSVEKFSVCSSEGGLPSCPFGNLVSLRDCRGLSEWFRGCLTTSNFNVLRIITDQNSNQILAFLARRLIFAEVNALIFQEPKETDEELNPSLHPIEELIESLPGIVTLREPKKGGMEKINTWLTETIEPLALNYRKNNHSLPLYPFEEVIEVRTNAETFPSILFIFQVHNEDFIDDGSLDKILRPFRLYNWTGYATVLTKSAKKKMDSRWPKIKTFFWKSNMGMDVGAFMWVIDYIHKEKFDESTILFKWHTKTNLNWRNSVSVGFSSATKLKETLSIFQQSSSVGMISSGAFCLKPNEMLMTPYSYQRENRFALNLVGSHNLSEYDLGPMLREIEMQAFGRRSTFNERQFVGGTIFMVRWTLILDLYHRLGSFWNYLIAISPQGHVDRSYMHAMERFLGYGIRMLGFDLYCAKERYPPDWFGTPSKQAKEENKKRKEAEKKTLERIRLDNVRSTRARQMRKN